MKNTVKKYWNVECMQGMMCLYREKIPISHINENGLKALLSYLLNKNGLEDAEVAEQYKTVPFKPRKRYYDIIPHRSEKDGIVDICFSCEVSSVSATATLVYG